MNIIQTFIPAPLCRECKIVKSQKELDEIQFNFNGYIIIEFGDNTSGPARVIRTYDNAVIRVRRNSLVYIEAYNIVEAFDNAEIIAYHKAIVYAYGDSKVIARDETYIFAYGNSKITACCKSMVAAYWNSIVHANDKSSIEAHDNSEVYLYDNSSADTYKGSTVHICGNDVVLTRNNFRE